MFQAKRTQIRRTLRKQELNKIFANRRKQLLQDKLAIFKNLDQAILQSNPQTNDMALTNRILNCLNEFPLEENTYIVVGNYLFNEIDKYSYIFPLLIHNVHYLENQMWCFKLMATIFEKMHKQDNQNYEQIRQQMEQMVLGACQIVREMIVNLNRSHTATDKQINIWLDFMEIVRIMLIGGLYNKFPTEALFVIYDVMSLLPPIEGQINEVQYTWWCLKAVLMNIDKTNIQRQLMIVSNNIIRLTLRDLPQERQECIEILLYLLEHYSIDFMSIIFNQCLITEILYIYDQIPALKPIITLFLKNVIQMCTIDQVSLLLNHSTHKLLTESVKWSMETRNNQCLQNSLASIHFILLIIKEAEEDKLFLRVQQDVDDLDFDKMIEGMSQQPQRQSIALQINLIIDDFYSQPSL